MGQVLQFTSANAQTPAPQLAQMMQAPDIALVAEGGGQRGVFTAGVLDAFMLQGFNPFRWMIGVSAGAQNMAAFALGEAGYARKVIMELTTDPRFFKPTNLLHKHPVLDLDWLFDHAQSDQRYHLPVERLPQQMGDRHLIISVFDDQQWQTCYIEPEIHSLMGWLKASSAIPYLYAPGVTMNDYHFQDGGVLSPIPLQVALDRGAMTVVVIRTTTDQEICQHGHKRQMLYYLRRIKAFDTHKTRRLERLLVVHRRAIERELRLLKAPPEAVNMIDLVPSAPLHSKTLGSHREALEYDYDDGFQLGMEFLQQLAVDRDSRHFSR